MMMTIREGKNGWWCMADNPASMPGPDPMCGDANALEWAQALDGQDRSTGGQGRVHLHAVRERQQQRDPYAAGPEEGNHWVTTGPHVMVLNATGMMAGYPDAADADTAVPYVMWPGTPYAHLMIPVQ